MLRSLKIVIVNTKEDQVNIQKMHKSSFKDNDNYPKEQIRENSKSNLGYLKSEYFYE
jgi:hypothetical protein